MFFLWMDHVAEIRHCISAKSNRQKLLAQCRFFSLFASCSALLLCWSSYLQSIPYTSIQCTVIDPHPPPLYSQYEYRTVSMAYCTVRVRVQNRQTVSLTVTHMHVGTCIEYVVTAAPYFRQRPETLSTQLSSVCCEEKALIYEYEREAENNHR